MIKVDVPATIFDMAELAGARTQIEWAVAREMWSAGQTMSIRNANGCLVALMGLYPVGNGAEAWFAVRPEAAACMLAITRQIRLTLASAPYPEIVTICVSDAGRRLAHLCGFERGERVKNGEIWHGRNFRRQQ